MNKRKGGEVREGLWMEAGKDEILKDFVAILIDKK